MDKNKNKYVVAGIIVVVVILLVCFFAFKNRGNDGAASADASADASANAVQQEEQPQQEEPSQQPAQNEEGESGVLTNLTDAGAEIDDETAAATDAELAELTKALNCEVYGIIASDEESLETEAESYIEAAKENGILLLVNMDTKTIQIRGVNEMENFLGAKEYEKIGDAIEEQLRQGSLENAVQAFVDGITDYMEQKDTQEE